MSAASTLSVWGILRPVEVVELAAAAGLELAAAATLLEMESYDGRNVWGSDGVSTGGAYVKGAEVTRDAYLRYRELLHAGTAGAQGVGPCQLTWRGYQDQADKIGGCWDWRANCKVGFATLAGLQRQHGLRDGFRRYNGSGPAAEVYADKSMAKLQKWRDRLGSNPPVPTDMPPPARGDDELSWTEPIPDHYAAGLQPMPAREAVAWGTAHAAHARDRATEARDRAAENLRATAALIGEVAALQAGLQRLEQRIDKPGSADAPALDLDALAEKVAARLIASLASRPAG